MISTLSIVLFFLASTSTLGLGAPTSLVSRQTQSLNGWADGYYIAAVGRDKKCLGVSSNPASAGTQVVATDCQNASTWRVPILPSGGAIVHEESQLVLDIGEGGEEDQITISQPSSQPQFSWDLCHLQGFTGNSTSQIFKYGSDNRLQLSNSSGWITDRCIDFGENGPHMYGCYPDNTNQVWLIRQSPEPKNLTAGVPQGGEVAVSRSNLNFLHPQGRKDICVSAISSSAPNATQGIALTYCAGTGFSGSGYNTSHELMEWSLPGSYAGLVKLGSNNLCLEAGATIHT
ncbi:hypothetical protein I302_105305 [Kwoniella bestiolae CBS 10118]|uniref:Uncharacterized protein n=1 Tax=Kwoniella bestiolae CBS 10118 TaxID=1296100 RepID=A0A1B9FSR9_9TREE|nr:hypothetical protein I302_08593 [Kwoniella bestiolae CBS 10118]OCF21814.1 hypothetical protein I302_08593 [Kwoniella bestiolae CBS 10118]